MEKVGAYTNRTTAQGEWRMGNPATNVRATPMLSEYFNMLQAELLAVLADASITPDKFDNTQITQAINAISDRNSIQLIDGVPGMAITTP